jgi:hypothetical protein
VWKGVVVESENLGCQGNVKCQVGVEVEPTSPHTFFTHATTLHCTITSSSTTQAFVFDYTTHPGV